MRAMVGLLPPFMVSKANPFALTPPRPEGLFYGLLKLQDKIDQMSLARKPTQVRLYENMREDFTRQVSLGQRPQPK